MILVDFEITQQVSKNGLLGNFEPKSLRNCRYNLRASRAFASSTGTEILLDQSGNSSNTGRHVWTIGPSETLMILTKETLVMPSDLMASLWSTP